MIYFFDSSALVKRYFAEAGSDVVRRLLASPRRRAASSLALVEVPAALRRKERNGDIDAAHVVAVVSRLAADMDAFLLVDIRPPVIDRAAALVMSYTLRAYDAIQLSSALHIGVVSREPVTFVCTDAELRAAAVGQGLRVLPSRR